MTAAVLRAEVHGAAHRDIDAVVLVDPDTVITLLPDSTLRVQYADESPTIIRPDTVLDAQLAGIGVVADVWSALLPFAVEDDA